MKFTAKASQITSILLLGAIYCNCAHATQLVVPSTNASIEGNSSDGGTFGEGGGGDFRMQTVYGASQFQFFGGPILITGLAFRPDASPQGGGNSSEWSSTPITVGMTIRLSTTPKAVDGLSSTFASNIGSDERTVLDGFVQVSSFNTLTGNGTKNFDIIVNFATAFLYDPSAGNLLLDSRTFTGGNRRNHTVDGVSVPGDAVSNIHTGFGNGGSPTALGNDSYGTIVQFSISPVPESSSGALLALGILTIGMVLNRKRTRIIV